MNIINPASLDRHLAKRTAATKAELNAANSKPPREPLKPIEKPLAGYQMAAAVTGTRPGKQETMQTLRAGLDTLHQVRSDVPDRANVWPDAGQNNGRAIHMREGSRALSTEMYNAYAKKAKGEQLNEQEASLLRKLPKDFESRMATSRMSQEQKIGYMDTVTTTATARIAGAGVCDDLTSAVQGRHASKLQPGQSMERFHTNNPAHTWPSVTLSGARPDHGENVILEAWAQDKNNMTPITREHAHFPGTGETRNPSYALDREISRTAEKDIAAIEKNLRKSATAEAVWKGRQEPIRDHVQGPGGGLQQLQQHFDDRAGQGLSPVGYSHAGIFAATPPLFDQGFRADAHNELNQLGNGVPLTRGPSSTELSPLTKDLKRDILATGVARDMGFSVREAKDVAEQNGHFVGDARRVLDQAPAPAGTPAAPATPAPEAWVSSPSISGTLKSVFGSSSRGGT